MKNVEMKVDKDKLTITVDLKKEFGDSKSGRNVIIASSEGNAPIPGTQAKIGINVYRSK